MIKFLLRKQIPRCFSTARIVPDEEWKELQEKINKINVNLNDAMKELKKPQYVGGSWLASKEDLYQGFLWSTVILFLCLFLGLDFAIEKKIKRLPSQFDIKLLKRKIVRKVNREINLKSSELAKKIGNSKIETNALI